MTEPNSAETRPDETPKPKGWHLGVMARLRAYFFAGILVTAPVSISFYLAWQFIKFMDNQVAPFLPPTFHNLIWDIPGFGLVMVVVGLTVTGFLTAGFAGRLIVRISDFVLARMPVIRSIYSAVKQIFETMLAQKANAFREVALIQYPRPGVWTIAFITGTTAGEVKSHFDQEMVNVYVPTTPNPTSGFLLFLPRADLRVLNMSVEDGLKMVLSTGIIVPEWHGGEDQPELPIRT
ncbi:conserved hypothetical protein [Magnetospirillum sp. LM-5]|uniref:DUF502 domain-containing protein n=1 Tax=Magnetospirillum sp. LM-5 TaxID=2681466 RepID=UPI00137D803C|nr:DUF502 domain-containing protein [Magnetospirillum sp. LM-5]CAA7614009.1 conserved hypothetical protein [Magnetospirillum sp. LM-5]